MIDDDFEEDDDLEEEEESSKCPFCDSADECPHLLLIVDKTFRAAEGGILMDAFNFSWSKLCEEHEDDPDFDESGPFEEMLSEVDSLSDAMNEYDHNGSPGMSCAYAVFYVSGKAKGKAALKRYCAGHSVPVAPKRIVEELSQSLSSGSLVAAPAVKKDFSAEILEALNISAGGWHFLSREMTLSSGEKIVHRFSVATGDLWKSSVGQYRHHFQRPLPSWVELEHPRHIAVLCRLAIERNEVLPDDKPVATGLPR
jgi:hypothetical protein